MATQVKHRRGTQSEIDAFTGAIGEIVVNTTEEELVLNDGATQGGIPTPKKRNTQLSFDNLASALANTSLKVGYSIQLKERTTGNGGGGLWDVVLASSVTLNTFNVVQCTGVASLALVLRTDVIDVKQFGAVGNGSVDDTAAIQAAIDYGESIIRDRFQDGATITTPKGLFLISSTLNVSSSNIHIQGESWSSSVIYAPDADFDLLKFDGSALALYGCGASNLRFDTPGDATAGSQLVVDRLINADFHDLYFVAHWIGITANSCARTFFTNVIHTQATRLTATSPSYAYDFTGLNSDVHINTYQIFMPDDRRTAYSISVRGSDGIYVCNGHQHGGVLFQPDNETCASVMFTEVYFDKSLQQNIIFTAISAAYRNYFFTSCYFRDAQNGVEFNAASTVENIKFIGCQFAGQINNGIVASNANVTEVKVIGSDFEDNVSGGNLGDADIKLQGDKHIITGCNFTRGNANGRAVSLNPANDSIVDDCDFNGSTMGVLVNDSGTGNKFGVLSGVNFKNKGTAVIANGTSSITVNHGLDAVPTNEEIQITPRTSLNGGVDFWISNVLTNTFDINVSNNVSNNTVFSWVADKTG